MFGIRIGASPSWFVVLFILIYVLSGYFTDRTGGIATEGYLVAVAAVLLFFASIVLHELGHALAARREGIATTAIDLWFFGGIAKLSRDTDSPGAEFKIAAAGPAVTAVICAICVGLAAALADGDALDVMLLSDDVAASPAVALLGFLALWNGALLIFNLVPAFPLDGGRLLRAAVWEADRRSPPRDPRWPGASASTSPTCSSAWASSSPRSGARSTGSTSRSSACSSRRAPARRSRRRRSPSASTGSRSPTSWTPSP